MDAPAPAIQTPAVDVRGLCADDRRAVQALADLLRQWGDPWQDECDEDEARAFLDAVEAYERAMDRVAWRLSHCSTASIQLAAIRRYRHLAANVRRRDAR